MANDNSTFPNSQSQPKFPLTQHPTGRWCKKIRGTLHYFGRDREAALASYLDQKERLHAGLTTADNPDELTVFHLCTKFLGSRKALRDNDELSERTFDEYVALSKRLIRAFGKGRLVTDLRPDDFAGLRVTMAKTWGPVRLKVEIVRTRTPFNWAYKNGLLTKPIVFGEGFRVSTRKTLRQHTAAQGPKMFEAAEIRTLLKHAGQPLKAMLYLGINTAMGNNDVATLPFSALDLDAGWIRFARVK